jgi:hypothetical protein
VIVLASLLGMGIAAAASSGRTAASPADAPTPAS